MKRFLGLPAVVLLTGVFSCAVVWAQATAQISGTVRDQSGAVLPGVEVTATQTDTGIARTAVTNEAGFYVLQNLPTGPHRLEAVLTGFRTYAQAGILLQVNSNLVINAVLEVGQVADTVEVQANAAMVETRSVGVGQVIENERILELPLNGRNPTELIALAGASVQVSQSPNWTMRGSVGYSVAGGLNFGVAYQLDGAMHNNPYDGLNMPFPFPDALQEFKVETGGLSAQNGMHSGAQVNSVTKSGTNEFHGDGFWFVRNYLFNARNAFAARRDSLKRNQFGGTIGGPILRNRLFFFAGYQGTTIRQDPSATLSFIPTAAMLAGDFTTVTSPQCRTTGQLNLRLPFVNNRINPTMFSKAAVNIAAKLPKTEHPCGEIRWGTRTISNEYLPVGRIDYQMNDKHSFFGRYFAVAVEDPLPYNPGDILTSTGFGRSQLAQLFTLGNTYLISPEAVNSFRIAVNRGAVHRINPEVFEPAEVGLKSYTYIPKYTIINVTNGFSIGCGTCVRSFFRSTAYQVTDDVSLVRGTHQMSLGTSLAQFNVSQNANVRSSPSYSFDQSQTGMGLADFLTGKTSLFLQSAPNDYYMRQWYFGLYGQDTWRVTPRLTFNYGVRWEPFFGLELRDEKIYNFDYERFRQGIKSSVFVNAPAGMYYPGDPGFPERSSMRDQWGNIAPRIGLAWDVKGDGRTSVRASYALAYDFVNGQYHLNTAIAPPFGGETRIPVPPGGLDDPFTGWPGGNPFPYVLNKNAPFTPYGPFLTTPYDIDTTHTGSWNLSLQRQVATNWIVSASYVGNQSAHLWVMKALNPSIFIGTAPCAINGRNFTTCSTTANVNERRRFSLERPQDGQYLGFVDEYDDGGTASYHGLILSAQRRAARGVNINGNYTWSHCIGDNATGGSPQNVAQTYQDLNNRRFDRGNCAGDRRHNFNLTTVAETPAFANPTLRAIGSNRRLSVIYRYLSGSMLTVTTGLDRALSGVTANQRPNQILGDPYGDKSSLKNFLNPRAFAQPDLGALGNMGRTNIAGPGTFQFDAALSRIFRVKESQRLELRAEAFNVTNSLRPNNPTTAFNNSNFGSITSSQDARVMQFALKYLF